jgi:hypothetical protein
MKNNLKNSMFTRRMIPAVLAAGLMAVFMTGCTNVICVSPSTMPITEKDTYTKLGQTSGNSSGVVVLGIPFVPSEPSRDARNKAIKNGKGNALIEVTEEYNMINLLVVAFFWTKVEGTAVKVERAGEEIE